MENDATKPAQPFVLTISRQLGSGAAFVGQQLAQRLGILYLDREILHRAAQQLQVPDETAESCEETITPIWQSVLQSFAYGGPDVMYTPPPLNLPFDQELCQIESRIMLDLAQQQSAIIIGRGGVHFLRDHCRHCSIYLYAHPKYRAQRVQRIYHLSAKDAYAMIEASDHARARFHRNVANKDWHDARQYDLGLNTSVVQLTVAVDIILAYVCERFGVTCKGTETPVL